MKWCLTLWTFLNPLLEDFKKAFGYNDAQVLAFKEEMEETLDVHSNFSLERENA